MTNKKQEKFNFIKHKYFDVQDVQNYVKTFNEQWSMNTFRQDNFYPHKNTETIFIYETDLNWQLNQPYNVSLISEDKKLNNMIEPIIKTLEKIHNGKRGQVLLIKLAAHKNIADHEDGGDYLLYTRRHHIPIITSPKTKFYVDDEFVNMGIGECWEINNAKNHAVTNDSDIDRIHLLIDIMPYAIINDK